MSRFVRARVAPRPGAVRLARLIGRTAFRRWARLQVSGAERVPMSGPVLLVANHRAFLDGPALFAASPRTGQFLVKAEAYRGLMGVGLALIDQLPVNRGRADRTVLRSAADTLRAEGLVAVFPEGTRGAGNVATVQHGVGWLLSHVAATVVPVYVEGTERRAAERRRAGAGIRVAFGPPLRVDPPEERPTRSAMARRAEQVRAGLARHVQAQQAAQAAEASA